ncbi:tetratricopeptide repeat protein, partial [bacterium]|nr:tetratricopeptide repeat protein [bacterium]
YWRSGQYEKALEKCQEILKKYPKSHLASNAQYFIAFIYDYNLNNSEQALKEYQKLLEKYPESRWIKAAKQQIDSLKAEQKN